MHGGHASYLSDERVVSASLRAAAASGAQDKASNTGSGLHASWRGEIPLAWSGVATCCGDHVSYGGAVGKPDEPTCDWASRRHKGPRLFDGVAHGAVGI